MDLPRMREGNQNVQFFACFAAPSWIEKKKVVQVTLDYMDSFHTLMRGYPDQIEQATTADDVRRITDAGKLVGILCVEGGHSIDDDLSILRMYHRLGARYMTLTLEQHQQLGRRRARRTEARALMGLITSARRSCVR